MGNLTRSFSDWEFACRGKCSAVCRALRMSDEFMEKLQALRDIIAKPITVTSGIRCKCYNAKIPGAAKNSWHIPRNGVACAADIRTSRSNEDVLALYAAADQLDFKGIGLYAGRIHVDTRSTKRVRWVDKSWSWA